MSKDRQADDSTYLERMALKRMACDRIALQAITMGDRLPPVAAPNIKFINALHYTVVGTLNAADIPATRKNLKTAFDVLYCGTTIEKLLNPQYAETLAKLDADPDVQNPPESAPGEDAALEDEATNSQLVRIFDRIRKTDAIETALASSLRSELKMPANSDNEAVIDRVRGKIALALLEQLEASHPGLTSDKDNTIWAEASLLSNSMVAHNIERSMQGASMQAMILDDTCIDDPMDDQPPRAAKTVPAKPGP